MGIPAFYRWLQGRYPRTVVDVVEEKPAVVNGVSVPIDTSAPNPNGMEFDNLYLDMNGIIHPCFHPEGLPVAPTTYEEVFAAVFKYIDRIFSIVRPRKLLYLAIDGVAPRAKMNQQRTRRFRAAKDSADKKLQASISESVGCSIELEENERAVLEHLTKLDSNVITPGTEFMHLMSSALRYYIRLRINGDPGWKGIKVILSDASVPGEGEHKIMSYIRLQRNLPSFDPNTRHCLYGLDADLIMLALATHEIHFSILREDNRKAEKTSGKGKHFKHRMGKEETEKGKIEHLGNAAEYLEEHISKLNFQFLNIWVLREYLAYDMRIAGSELKTDLECMIDDFVFMCLFIGNDFLPQIPSLEISEGAIDLLITVYKKEFCQMGGHLTNSFQINVARMEHFVRAVGSYEGVIFRKRSQMQKKRERRFQHSFKCENAFDSSKWLLDDHLAWSGSRPFFHGVETAGQSKNQENMTGYVEISESVNRVFIDTNAEIDKVKLGEEGWKERYYKEKFETESEDEILRTQKHAVFRYLEGICWVMSYYYKGVCSWQWFYPYHYAPFASDFKGLDQLKIHFMIGEPFKPLDQLMAVLPAASAHALPLYYRRLMTDSSSPILDFYPSDFELDMNGKSHSWKAICKLPFIDEARLHSEIAKVEHMLTEEERQRNCLGLDILFVRMSHPLGVATISFSRQVYHLEQQEVEVKQEIDPKISGGMNGFICISDKPEWPVDVYSPINGMPIIKNNEVISVYYKYPPFHSHTPRLPQGVILPHKTVTKLDDSALHSLWHETVVSQRVLFKRPIAKSISGAHLAKLAYKLVSQHCATKQDGIGKMKTEVLSKNALPSKVKENRNSDPPNLTEPDKGDGIPSNSVTKLGSCAVKEQVDNGDHSGAEKEIIEMDINLMDGEQLNAERSRKRKRKSRKTKKSDYLQSKDGQRSVSSNSINKIENGISKKPKKCDFLANRANGYEEQDSRVVRENKDYNDHVMLDKLVEAGSAVLNNNFHRGEDNNHWEGREGSGTHFGAHKLEIEPEVKSGRNQQRTKKRKHRKLDRIRNENIEKLESAVINELGDCDGRQLEIRGVGRD